MRIAACQMVSGTNIEANIHTARALIDSAAQSGAELIVLPEYFSLMPSNSQELLAAAEKYGNGPYTKSDESSSQREPNLARGRYHSIEGR